MVSGAYVFIDTGSKSNKHKKKLSMAFLCDEKAFVYAGVLGPVYKPTKI